MIETTFTRKMAVLDGVQQPFNSFWMAGFESACHINRSGRRVDMIAMTQHDQQADADYVRLKEIGITAVRDAVRWHLVDQGGRYDFSSLASMADAARKHDIQVIWTLCHYGWPDDLDLLSPAFVDRFARYCRATAEFLADKTGGVPFYTPINEISYLTWEICDKVRFHPFATGRGEEVKRQLIRAAIAGCEAIWEADPRAQIVHVEPMIHVVPARHGRNAAAAKRQHESQFQVWEMLIGNQAPELGGHPRYLGIMGLNYYFGNQWVYPNRRLRWDDDPRDDRWVPLHQLLARINERYQRPLLISETSHLGVGRGAWIKEIGHEVALALQNGVPLQGVCIYPILNRPDWHNPRRWHDSGLWNLVPNADGVLQRILEPEYAEALLDTQRLVEAEIAKVF